jgi:tryptophan-rich hypothetical protein
MNNINVKKLINSKWTATNPINKEKHFLITELEFDENNNVRPNYKLFLERLQKVSHKKLNSLQQS